MNQWTPDMTPVMMTDDIAFVGGSPVSCHCLVGKDGLILLDAGYPDMLAGIQANLKALGLNLSDVRYILHTHGHIDHFGCTASIVRLTGAKTLVGREDGPIVTGEAPLSWAKELGLAPAEPFVPDKLLQDGDEICLCGRNIRCLHVPGHTQGTYAFFIETRVGGHPRTAAMHGGVGLNSLERGFLERYGLPLRLREDFRAGLHRLMPLPVDVVLGNHPRQAHMAEKIARMSGPGNPFVDPEEWKTFLRDCEKKLDEMLEKENADGSQNTP